MAKPKQKAGKAGLQVHEREIVELAVGLGSKLLYPNNKSHAVVESEKKIIDIARRVGFSNNFYNDIQDVISS